MKIIRPLPHKKGTALMTASRRKGLISRAQGGEKLPPSLARAARIAQGQENHLKMEASNTRRKKGVTASIKRGKK